MKYLTLREQLMEERRKNEALRAKLEEEIKKTEELIEAVMELAGLVTE